jgi:hypothetical protein
MVKFTIAYSMLSQQSKLRKNKAWLKIELFMNALKDLKQSFILLKVIESFS